MLSTDSLHRLLSILRQSLRRAQARDSVKRNVALPCDVLRGPLGAVEVAHTRAAADLLTAAERQPAMYAMPAAQPASPPLPPRPMRTKHSAEMTRMRLGPDQEK
jgi:hypothetical protein